MLLRCGLVAVVGASLLALACGKDPTQPSCTIAIASADQTRTVVAAVSSFSIGVLAPAGCGWTASTTGGFLTITSGSSGSGNGSVQVSAAANDGVARLGTVVVGGASATITQQAAPAPACAFDVTPLSATVGATGGAVSVTVTVTQGVNCAWTAVANDAFVSVIGGSGTGNGTVGLAVAANSGPARTGTAMIAGRTLTIEQDPVPAVSCSYSMSPRLATIGAAGGLHSVTVTTEAPCPWQPTKLFNTFGAFLTVVDTAARTGSGTFRVQVPPNQGTSRIDYVHAIQGQPTVNAGVVQDELPGACQVNVSPPAFNLSSAQQTLTLTVDLVVGNSTLCPIFVRDTNAGRSFLVFSSADFVQKPTGPTTLTLNVPANAGTNRSTYLSVGWGFRIDGNSVFVDHEVFVQVAQAASPQFVVTSSRPWR